MVSCIGKEVSSHFGNLVVAIYVPNNFVKYMHQLEIAERIGCSVAVNKNILVHSLEMKENFY